jgi:DNA polymerase (family X)
MNAENVQIAELLRQYARALEIEGAGRFKVKAYRRAADAVESLPEEVATLISRGEDLTRVPTIGKAISAKIAAIVKNGTLPQLKESIAKLTPEMVELTSRPNLDPKKVASIYKKLGIKSLAELQIKLESGELRNLVGARLAYHVQHGLDERPRTLLWAAEGLAANVEQFLNTIPGVAAVVRVGSLRRKAETVGDLNFLIAGGRALAIFKRFAAYGAVQSFEPAGKLRMRFRLSGGRAVTLAWTNQAHVGLGILLETGSAEHLKALKTHADRINRQLTVSSLRSHAATEQQVYATLELDYIEPELREGRGEVDAAASKELPRLIELRDLRGDLHMHTVASDGANTLEQMATAAHAKGYEYIAITDHSQSLKLTNGLSEKRLFAHLKAIDKLNNKLDGIVILKSAEVDILEDGRLDYSDEALKELDFTICSIHSKFGLGRREQTQRILRAMDNRYFNILGHATGRLLLKREGYELDLEKVIRHAVACGCYFEINSSPDRLDLSDEHAKMAKEAGIKIAINTDAHSTRELEFMAAGVNQARRGWLTKADVLNSLRLAELKSQLRR